MHSLHRKLWRDLGKIKGQVFAVALVMACGLAVLIISRSLVVSLEGESQGYYQSQRLADLFCDLKRAPNSLRSELEKLPGIASLETRVRGILRLEMPGMVEMADGLIYSIPDDRPAQLNKLYLRRGRLPQPGSSNEVVVSEPFAKAHGISPGHRLSAILYGAREELVIVGIVLSPEFVFETRPGEVMPDQRRFGVFWMNERPLSIAFNLRGAFNNVVATLAPGANADEVIEGFDRLLLRYGSQIAYGREYHPSARKVEDDIRVLRLFSVTLPALFLFIAAFMCSAVLTRLVRLQREQIAQLKALGYSSRAIGWHYLEFALVIVAIGLILGAVIGISMGYQVVGIYHRFFFLPNLQFRIDYWAFFFGLSAATMALVAGVWGAVHAAASLPPAEAMRPEPPSDYTPSWVERLGLQRLIPTVFRMALRNLERRPWQAVFTLLGLALATAIPMIPGSMRDGIAHIMDVQWSLAQRQDATVNLIEPGSGPAADAVRQLPGVVSSEAFRAVPARLRFEHRQRRVTITGLEQDALLYRVLDKENRPVPVPFDGLLLSAKLAEVLGVVPGDTVRIEVQEGHRPRIDAKVQGTITDFAGLRVYMEINALRRLMREGPTVSGIYVSLDEHQITPFLDQLRETPRVGAVTFAEASRQSFKRSTGEMLGIIQGVYFFFAIVVAFGVVYNGARITLSERSRDLATLRVIGFSPKEVTAVLISELVILTLVAIPPGLWIGSQIAASFMAMFSTESIRMPLILSLKSYVTCILVVLASSLISFTIVSRRLRDLDLLSVLKARD